MSDTNVAAAAKPKLYPLTGRVVSEVKRAVTKGASPKPYAIFSFEYGVKRPGGETRTDRRTAKAFGRALENIEPALAAGGEMTLVGRFDTTGLGQTLVVVGLPLPPRGQQAG